MPRGFTEDERRQIKASLLASGHELFEARGLRHASVEEIAKAAAISKGAFYLFFESKEALLMAIIARADAELRRDLMAEARRQEAPPPERLRRVLRQAFAHWRHHPLMGWMSREDVEALYRTQPQGTQEIRRITDERFIEELLGALAADGARLRCDAALAGAIMRAIFFATLQEDRIGARSSEAIEALLDGAVARILAV